MISECTVREKTLTGAYHSALWDLYNEGRIVLCPDYDTRIMECGMTLTVKRPTAEPMISRLMPAGPRELEQYRQEILDGILDFEIEKGNWAYTYHNRMAEQIPFILEELRRNPYSRRAVIDTRDWQYDSKSTSPACLQHIQFFIRDNGLDMCVLFRSNDAVKATFMNAFALICLQKKLAKELGILVGTYTHRANSFHAYEQDWELLRRYVKDIERKRTEDLTYRYIGEWDELMEDAKPEIAKMVEELKGR